MTGKIYAVVFHGEEMDILTYFSTFDVAQDYRSYLYDTLLDDDGEPMYDQIDDDEVIEVEKITEDAPDGCVVYESVQEAVDDGAVEL